MKNFVSCEMLPFFKDDNTIDLLSNIIGCMYCGIIISKIEGEFLIWNSVAAEVLGKKEESVPYAEWSEFYGCHDPETEKLLHYTELPLYKAMNGDVVENNIILIKNKTTPRSWISCNASPLFKEGVVSGGVIVFQNITNEKLLEESEKELLENIRTLKEQQQMILEKWSGHV